MIFPKIVVWKIISTTYKSSKKRMILKLQHFCNSLILYFDVDVGNRSKLFWVLLKTKYWFYKCYLPLFEGTGMELYFILTADMICGKKKFPFPILNFQIRRMKSYVQYLISTFPFRKNICVFWEQFNFTWRIKSIPLGISFWRHWEKIQLALWYASCWIPRVFLNDKAWKISKVCLQMSWREQENKRRFVPLFCWKKLFVLPLCYLDYIWGMRQLK